MDVGVVIGVVVAVIAAVATGYAYFRSSAVKVWEQNSEAYRARVELLETANTELRTKQAWLEQRIHELEARPDWTQVVALMGVTEGNIIKAVEGLRVQAELHHAAALAHAATERLKAREAQDA